MHPKAASAGLAGMVTTILFYLLSTYGHVVPPDTVVAAVTGLVAAAAAHFGPEKPQDTPK